jgi:hypothetical protein
VEDDEDALQRDLGSTLRRFGRADADGAAPILWWRLSAQEAHDEWPALYDWVELLRQRYPNGIRLPDCWYRHNDLVEALSALRDFERACFCAKAPAGAAVDWQRAFRDVEQRLELWIRRSPCGVSERGHEPVTAPRPHPTDWEDFVARDVGARSGMDLE